MEGGKDDPLPHCLSGASKCPFPYHRTQIGPTESGIKIAGLVAPRRPATTAPLTLRCHRNEVKEHTPRAACGAPGYRRNDIAALLCNNDSAISAYIGTTQCT